MPYGVAVNKTSLSSVFWAVPVPFTAAPLKFNAIDAVLMTPLGVPPSNRSYGVALGIAPAPPGFATPERYIVNHIATNKQNPASFFVILGGFYYPGGYQFVRERGIDVSTITVPVLQISLYDAVAVGFALQSYGGEFNVTVTDTPGNDWIPVRTGAGMTAVSSIICAWNIILFGLSIYLMYKSGLQKNIGSAVMVLDACGCAIRLIFCLDPLADRFIPAAIQQILLTGHLPFTVAGIILITSLWVEVSSESNLKIVGGLTTTAIPSTIIICIVTVLEFINSATRAAGYLIVPVLYASSIVALLTLAFTAAYTLYCAIKVFRFTSSVTTIKRHHKTLQSFSIRVSVSIAGMLGLVISSALYAAGYGASPVGDSALIMCLTAFSTLIANAQIFALFSTLKQKLSASAKSRATNSGSHKANSHSGAQSNISA